jgi:hypothetical protein
MNAPDWAVIERGKDADRYSAMCNEAERQDKAEAEQAARFVQAIAAGDPDAAPDWTGTVADYAAGRKLGMVYGDAGYPRRKSTVAECLQSGLDYPSGPGMEDVLKVLSLAMNSADPVVSTAARDLVQRAAVKFAEHNTDEIN